MAEFDDRLTALFQQEPSDPNPAASLAEGALARIEAQDRRRGLILTTGIVSGFALALITVAKSGAAQAFFSLAREALGASPSLGAMTPVWTLAAVGLGLYALATFRTARAL